MDKRANFFKTKKLLLILLIPLLVSCGYYSFKGALPSHLKTIAVPLFNNTTSDAGIQQEITDLLTDLFIEDNSLQLVDETKADVILSGAIVSVQQSASNVASGETVTEYKLTVRVKAKCQDIVTGKVMFDKNFENYSLLDQAASGLEERKAAITEALEQIADEIVNTTLGGW